MVNSFARMGAGLTGATGKPMHRTRHRSGKALSHSGHFRGIVVVDGTR
jgi:hypothetical protein